MHMYSTSVTLINRLMTVSNVFIPAVPPWFADQLMAELWHAICEKLRLGRRLPTRVVVLLAGPQHHAETVNSERRVKVLTL